MRERTYDIRELELRSDSTASGELESRSVLAALNNVVTIAEVLRDLTNVCEIVLTTYSAVAAA